MIPAALGDDVLTVLFAEELGVVVQVARSRTCQKVEAILQDAGLDHLCHRIGEPQSEAKLKIVHAGESVIDESIVELQRAWAETTLQMQLLRDNPECAQQEFDLIQPEQPAKLFSRLSFDPADDICAGTGR